MLRQRPPDFVSPARIPRVQDSWLKDRRTLRFPPLVEGRFIRRLNRFAALVDVDRQEHTAHVPNSGRLGELLVAGCRVLLAPAPPPPSISASASAAGGGAARKTAYDLALVDTGGGNLSSIDARLPNKLLAEALAAGRLPQFAAYPVIRPEQTYGESRLDFLLEAAAPADRPDGGCYLETKSATLVVDGVAMFPDAPTARGVKHLHSLMAARAAGYRAAVVFVVQRSDAGAFAPHDAADPLLGAALREAVAGGVAVYAYRCRVDETAIALADALPVRI